MVNKIAIKSGGVRYIEHTLSCESSSVDANDVIADTEVITNCLNSFGPALLFSLVLHDGSDNGDSIDIYFLRSDTSMGTEDSAIDISDANALEVLGGVSITSADYFDLINGQVAQPSFDPFPIVGDGDSNDVYVAAVYRGSGTPTFGASGLSLKLGILD